MAAGKCFPWRDVSGEKIVDTARPPGRHGSGMFFLIVLISGLNVLDSVLTLMLLDLGAVEANPIVGAAIQVFGDHFWVWKYGIVSVASILLASCGERRSVKRWLTVIALAYSAVVFYQITILGQHGF